MCHTVSMLLFFGLRGTCPRFPTGRHDGQWESSGMSEQSSPNDHLLLETEAVYCRP